MKQNSVEFRTRSLGNTPEMEKVPGDNDCENLLSSVITSMFIKDADISHLWSLDLIGIKEPAEHSKTGKELAIRNNFLETTTIDKFCKFTLGKWAPSFTSKREFSKE